MTHDELRDLACRWMSFWQGAPLDAFDGIHDEAFVDHSASGRDGSRDAFRGGIIELYEAFPDFEATTEDLIVAPAGRRVCIRWRAVGTHRGPFLGLAPTGRRIRFAGIEIIEARDGRVVARWGEWDGLGLRAQLLTGGTAR